MPPIEIEIVGDESSQTPSDRGFIRVRRLTLRTTYEDGTRSDPFRYDVVDRDALDAVVMVLYAPREGAPGDPEVCMRTALRPPVALRRERALPVPDARPTSVIWELPAGLIEKGETGEDAVMNTASRETEEETGYVVAPGAFARLGAAVYLSPGLCGEKIHVVRAEVARAKRVDASSGEVVERASVVEWWPLSVALARAATGDVEDCKTELALLRLRAWLDAAR